MYNSVDNRVSAAEKYIVGLGWSLVLVHGYGNSAKKPVFVGWPDLRPNPEWFEVALQQWGDAGLGVNLGASGLIDLEGDSEEGEAVLDDLCQDVEFPFYQSRRSKHRIFQSSPDVTHLDLKSLKIEFRAGRHQSILPPSIMDGVQYKWIVSPFDTPPPPLPARVLEFYHQQRAKPENAPAASPRAV